MLNSAIYSQSSAYQKSSIKLNKSTKKTKTESQEQYLLQNIAQGNHQAFWQLWLLHETYLYRRCQMWMGGNQIDGEEALSQARLKAWEKLPNYASTITNAKAWLTRMTHNLCVDIHRKRQRSATNMESIDEIAVTTSDIISSNSDSPESTILHHELKIYIRHAINTLTPRLRDVWNLSYYYQMSYADIAQRLMISKNNVYKRIQQGRITLQKQLNEYFSGINSSLKSKLEEKETSKKSPNIPVVEASNSFISHQNISSHSLANTSNQKDLGKKHQQTNSNYQIKRVETPPVSNKRNSKEKASLHKLSETDSDLAVKTLPVNNPESSDFSIPVVTEYFTEIINYQVTALCLDKLSFAL